MQVLISELAQEETHLIKPDKSYSVWSPYDAFDAANTMLEVLQAAKSQNNDIAPPIASARPSSHRSCTYAGCDKPLVYESHCPLR
ncbi:hypothetical protein [Anabaena sp. PCC 7108]|uniref:hypothetical protein n=1 Tax=Anabaena sp. PCC 7108 TaxID=163908 RepID=UPI00034DF520|nr:hypothetical protein [Anabaena sp. PCC 7108]